jgi:MFS family permease
MAVASTPRHDQPEGLPSTRGWVRLAGITCFSLALGMATNTLEPAVLGHRLLELSPASKNTALGLMTFTGLVIACLWQPIIGGISDRTGTRWGRRVPFLVLGTPLAIAAMYLIALAPDLGLLVVGLLSYQTAANTVQGPWQALIPDLVPSHRRGLASGMKAAFDITAFILGRQTSANLVAAGHVSESIGVAAGAYVLALALTTVAVRENRGELPPAPAEGTLGLMRAFKVDWRSHPAFAAWFMNRFLFWAGFVALNTFVLFFMIDVVNMPEASAQRFVGQLSTALGLALLLVTLPSGLLADRWGRRPLVAFSGLVAALGTLLVLVFRTALAVTIAGAVIGLAAGTFLSANWALVTDIVPEAEAARYLGLANIASAGGSALARLAGGLIIDPLNRLTGQASPGYLALYGLTAAFFLLGTGAILRLPPTYDRPRRA